jgi:ribonuclease E
VLDEPTDSTTPTDETPAPPAKAPRRRRATKAAAPAASPAEAIAATAEAATGGDAGEQAAAAAAVGLQVTSTAETGGATGEAPASPATTDAPSPAEDTAPIEGAAPAKRVRKAPAKKAAAPRKRAAKKVADAPADPGAAGVPTPSAAAADPGAAPEDVPLTEEELAAQAALLDVGEPVVAPVEQDPDVAEAVADDVSTPAVVPAEPPAPAKRTRRRATAAVTFQAPEPVVEAAVEPPPADLPPAEPTSADLPPAGDAPAPRRRRRAGTAGALPPSALVPELIEPVPVPEPLEPLEALDTGPDADEDADEDRPRRRRRGRRGRGARRPEDEGDDVVEAVDEDELTTDRATSEDEPDDAAETDEADESDDADDEPTSGTRRRRRRRRSGTASEEVAETVAAVKEPREPRTRNRSGATSADEDGVRGISGSTRMAAKRVRRQEGRDSGRKRTAILSEAEFLARREAVDRTMVVRQKGDRTQIAVLEDGILVEHYVTKASAQSYAGNVYLGRVQNVLPSMEAAFVDIGKSRNAVLYAGEVNYAALGGSKSRSIESVLKSGQEVLVQVSKDPIGHKGARLTGQVSLPGRYLVYVPEGSMTGISRKLPEPERERLKKILKKVVPDDAGVIIRTAAEGASEEEISGDVRRLQAQWEVIQTKAAKGGAPVLLHSEPDLVIRVVRDVFNEDFTRLVVQGDSEWETIRDYVEFVAPDLAPRLSRHTSDQDVFAEHRIDEQLLKALDRKVYLPSGGSLVIDRTEAMVVIDVNTGKFVGKGGNLEETVTRNNLEAAEEIARQLRLRDVGGIIVVDFIDMVLESNRDLVVRRLVECLGRDRTKHQVAEVTSLGLVQMTRKRVGQGLLESFSEPCESCNGRGVHVHPEPVDERRGGNGDRAPKARTAKPLPADAPRPGAAIAGTAAAPVLDPLDPAAAAVAEEAAPAPRRRRRGGRGTGAATVAPESELSELLADAAPSEADAVAAAVEVVDATVEQGTIGQAWGPDVELNDQPTPAMEDMPVDATPSEIVAAVVDADLEIGTGIPGGAVEPSAPDQPVDLDEPTPEPVPDGSASPDFLLGSPAPEEPAAPAPRRRRRATSRPAGPPTA